MPDVTDPAPVTPGSHLRAYREAAGLSREDLALGLETEPHAVSARSRAELLALIEDGVAPISPAFHGELLALVALLAAAFADRPPAPPASAAA